MAEQKSIPYTCIPVPKIEDDCYDWYARHEHLKKRCREDKFDIVFIGDSITHFWEGDPNADHGSEVWKEYYGRRRVFNIGYGFDRTQNVLCAWSMMNLPGRIRNYLVNLARISSVYQAHPCDTAEELRRNRCGNKKLRKMFPKTPSFIMNISPGGEKTASTARLFPSPIHWSEKHCQRWKCALFWICGIRFEDRTEI